MAYIRRPDSPEYAQLGFDPAADCFVCGQPLGCERLIYWVSCANYDSIWMHAPCARSMAESLIYDSILDKHRDDKAFGRKGGR